MSGFIINNEAVTAERGYGRVGAGAQVWQAGDPLVWIATGLDILSIDDGSPLLVADVPAGFALEPSTGTRPGSRPADSATANLRAGMNGPTTRTFVKVDAAGLKIHTANIWAIGAPGTLQAPVAANIGTPYEITSVVAAPPVLTRWGVEIDAATVGTEVAAFIEDIFNADGLPIASFGGAGASVNFTVRLG